MEKGKSYVIEASDSFPRKFWRKYEDSLFNEYLPPADYLKPYQVFSENGGIFGPFECENGLWKPKTECLWYTLRPDVKTFYKQHLDEGKHLRIIEHISPELVKKLKDGVVNLVSKRELLKFLQNEMDRSSEKIEQELGNLSSKPKRSYSLFFPKKS